MGRGPLPTLTAPETSCWGAWASACAPCCGPPTCRRAVRDHPGAPQHRAQALAHAHRAGDELLVSVGKCLRAMLRPTDVLARLGGDEFAILVEDLHRQRDAIDLAERIHRELEKPM